MDPQQLVASTHPVLQTVGAAFYFHPDTVAVGKAMRLDGFRFYILGRGGVMGDVDASVVTSAFGYFHPAVIDRIWNSARERVPARSAARAYLECGHQLGRARLGDVADLDVFCRAAEAVVAAADPGGLTLFAGIAAQPLPDDLPARTVQLAATLREHRGSAHLLAVRAVGLPSHVAHFLRRPNDYATFGWGDAAPTVTDDDRAALERAEALTDELVAPDYSVVSSDEADHVAVVVGDIAKALQG